MTNRPAQAPLISLKEVHLSLGRDAGRVHILKGVDLDVAAGQSLGIVGPSGSGKSTLLMVMAGLERADAGAVMVGEEDLTRLSEDALARFRGREIGIIFQSFHLVPNMTALENVAIPLELAGRRDAFEAARAELDAVGLGERMSHYPAQMSGGEQQRVAIARALVTQPPLLLADEPTGNLDETTGAQIVDLMFSASRERGMTLVLVTHDPALAARCDRTIRVRSGHIETVDAPERLVAGA
ncbi:ABC transporter ATP-binding protein [Stappia sp.]|uniref:ABC transporter ATP-binding protein n=1 Tax=Stappia sp. TaxID=1870903 RepID=UPI0032D9A4E9